MADAVRIEISVEAVDNTSKTVQELIRNLQSIGTAANKTQSGMDKASSSVSKFDAQADKTTKTLQGWMKQKWQLALEAKDRVSPVLSTLKSGLNSLTSRAWGVTMKVFDFVTSPVRGILNLLRNPLFQAGSVLGVSIGLKDTIDTYKGFESAMSQVQAVSGASSSELDKLTEKAKEMGATTKFTAEEAAEAFNYMAMAGWKTADMMGGIEGILNLAAASGEDLATTSDIVTDALTAFNMQAGDAGHFADVLAAASSNANTNVSMMGETFKYVGAMAGTLGYSIEDVGLAVGLMANAGIKASMAGTELNSIFTRLSTNSNHARDAIEDIGIKFFDDTGKARAFSDVLKEMRAATANYTDEQKAMFANTVAGTRAQAGLLAMLNASTADYNKLAEAVNNADGASSRMAETMMDNVQGSFTRLQSAVDGAKISLGERLAPYLRQFADFITDNMPAVQRGIESFMDWFDQKVDTFKGRWNDAINSDEFQSADFFGKVKVVWDKIIGEPLSDWWQTSGKQKVANVAGDIGSGLGTAIRTGVLALLGIDISDAADQGVSIGKSFAEGFADGLDFSTVACAFAAGIWNMLGDVGKLLPGGEAPGLDTLISGVILSKMASPLISGGKFLFGKNAALGGSSLAGTILGSATAGTGLLGFGSNAAITLGAGNLAGGASLSAGALSALGLGSVVGGAVGAGTLISGGVDFYRASKSQDQAEKEMLKDTGTMKVGGALSGAAVGAAIGSIIPGLGTLVGGLIGAGIGGVAGLMGAKKRKQEYEDAAAAAEAEAAAQELIAAKAAVAGTPLNDVRFKSEALNQAFRDTNVSAEEFQTMFSESVTNRIRGAFGTISLSLQEIRDMSNSIVFDGMEVEVEKMQGATASAEKALNSIREDLSTVEKFNWKASLGFSFTQDDIGTYQTTIDNFVKDAQTYITDKHYEGTLALRLIAGVDADTGSLDAAYASVKEKLQGATEELQAAVQRALEDGVISTEPVTLPDGTIQLSELAEITNLQNQVNEIVNQVAAAEQSAQLDALKIKYGGASLDADSFTRLQSELAANMQAATQNYDDALQISLTNLHLQLAEGAISQEDFDAQFAELQEQYQLKIEDMNVRVESFQLETLAEAFSEELDGILPQLEGSTAEKLQQVMETALAVSPEPATWTQEQMATWFNLEGLDAEARTAISTMLQSVAATIPDSIKAQFAVEMDAMDLSEAQETLKTVLSTDIAEAIESTDLSAAYSGLASLQALLAAQAEIEFAKNIDVTVPVTVAYDYTQINPNPPAPNVSSLNWAPSYMGGAQPSVSGNAKHRATGGFTSGAELSWVGEDGPEAIIPLSTKRRGVGLGLYEQVGEILGVTRYGESSIRDITDTTSLRSDSVRSMSNIAETSSYISMQNVNYHANGGFTNGAELSWVGEDGPEAIIPLSMKRRERGLELYEQVGEILGVAENANGGVYGFHFSPYPSDNKLPTESDWGVSTHSPATPMTVSAEPIIIEAQTTPSTPASSAPPVSISVQVQPSFVIDGGDRSEDELVEILRRHMGDIADDIGDELAERLTPVFDNMPLKGAM